MPWHQEAMKDAITCDKLRRAGNKPRPVDVRMGKPVISNVITPVRELTRRSETSQYPEEKKSKEIPGVAASEMGGAQT